MIYKTKVLTIDGQEHDTEKEAKKHLKDAIFEVVGPIVDQLRNFNTQVGKAEHIVANLDKLAWAAKLNDDLHTAPDPDDIY